MDDCPAAADDTSTAIIALSGLLQFITAMPRFAPHTFYGFFSLYQKAIHAMHLSYRPPQASVWEWSGPALDEGDDAAACLSAFMGFPVRLVRYLGTEDAALLPQAAAGGAASAPAASAAAVAGADPGGGGAVAHVRPTDEWAPGHETRFSDGYPTLVASEASLADLNARLAAPIPMNRFRHVAGCTASIC